MQQQQKPRAAAAAAVAGPQPTVAGKPAATAPTMESCSSKKRKVILSPVNTSPPPSPVSCGIPHTDGAEETPTTPPKRERTPGSKTPAEVQPAPPPLPMTRLSRSPYTMYCAWDAHGKCTAYITEIAQVAICNMCYCMCKKSKMKIKNRKTRNNPNPKMVKHFLMPIDSSSIAVQA